MGEFVSPGLELGTATEIVFGPDGNLYVGTTRQLVQQTGPVYYIPGRIPCLQRNNRSVHSRARPAGSCKA